MCYNMPMPTLSIVIPTKNEEEFLPRLLRSIKLQSVQPLEVIVADAGSTDATEKIAKQYDAKIVEGGMPGPGRNRGAEAAEGDLIFFFDADVELLDKDFLKNAIKGFEFKKFDVATVDVMPLDGNKYDVFSHHVYNRYVRLLGTRHAHAPGFCLLARRAFHGKIGGFDEAVVFCEDSDYAQRACKQGRFGWLSDINIHVSTRRQERDGRLSMGVKYIFAELHMIFIGPIRHHKFNYTFGHSKK